LVQLANGYIGFLPSLCVNHSKAFHISMISSETPELL